MDSEDVMYDSYDGEYLNACDEEDYLEEIDEDEGVSEDSSESGDVSDDSSEESEDDMGVSDDSDEEESTSDESEEDSEEEEESTSDESEEYEDDLDYWFVDNVDDPDFLSCYLQGTYTLEFDGASKGNPGNAGAGAVLRNPDGSVAHKIMKGVGVATNNVAEYEALNLGLKYAQSQGIDRIQVKGDSNLVCKQVNGDWKTRSKNLTDLNMEAKNLKSHFKEFHIDYVPRASNFEADALAKDAVNLPDGKSVTL